LIINLQSFIQIAQNMTRIAVALTSAEEKQLRRIVAIAQKLIDKSDRSTGAGKSAARSAAASPVRRRRSGKELIAFRKAIKSERKSGVPVARLAKKYGVSMPYIYQLR